MNWFRRKKETAVPGTVQLRSGERHPFGMLADYVPLQNGELQLYRAVREAVPVVDAAIYKLIRMTGGVRATCQDAAAQRQLQTFLRTVPTGRGQQGINAFLDCYGVPGGVQLCRGPRPQPDLSDGAHHCVRRERKRV